MKDAADNRLVRYPFLKGLRLQKLDIPLGHPNIHAPVFSHHGPCGGFKIGDDLSSVPDVMPNGATILLQLLVFA
jgi:hypothetical protein